MTPADGPPSTGFAYLDEVLGPPRSVLAFAHRGGAGHPDLVGLENTMAAFRHAVDLGYRYLETDVHATNDGVVMAFHDDGLDRVTDRAGRLSALSAAEIANARIAGRHEVPPLAVLLEELPDCRFNIDIKSGPAVDPLAELIERTGSHERVLVGSFSLARVVAFRRRTRGKVATSAAPLEVAGILQPAQRLARRLNGAAALQVPLRRGPVPIVTARFVRRAHHAGVHVHVWTVDEAAEMERLVDLGVDGIISDRTDVLKDVLSSRGLWRDTA